MSLVVERLIFCDRCGLNNWGDDCLQSTHRIRMGRRKEGWKVGPPKDYCPDCLKTMTPTAQDKEKGK